MDGKLLCKVLERIERVARVEAFLILTVAALDLTVVPRGIRANEFVADPQLGSRLFEQRRQITFAVGKAVGKLKVRRLSLSAKELISSDALIFLRRNGGEAMKYECLKLEERRIIEEMYAKGAKPGEIAERVGKCQATIYRELERGKTGETDSRFRQGYSAAVAEARVNRSYRNRGRRKAAQ